MILFQAFEWIIMSYIIKTQMNRSVEEITFDHQHERITEAIRKSDTITYRRYERKFKVLFFIAVFFVYPFLEMILPHIVKTVLLFGYKEDQYADSEWKKLG